MLEENARGILCQLQWNQSINVYGITSSRCEYINTCEVYELKTLLSCLPSHWWKSFALELINKSGWYQYLEVKPEHVRGAVAALSMISHSGESCDGYLRREMGLSRRRLNPPLAVPLCSLGMVLITHPVASDSKRIPLPLPRRRQPNT